MERTVELCAHAIKRYCFITDDVKADWWESENEKRIFHHKLVAEFEKLDGLL